MDLFFAASKMVALVFTPGNLIAILGLGAAGLAVARKTRRFGKMLGVVAGGLFLFLAIVPIGPLLLGGLERRFPSLDDCDQLEDTSVAGIILLGGGVASSIVEGRVVDDLNEAADRVRLAARLAHRFPEARLVVSGGQAFENGTARPEADALATLLEEMGIARERIVLESQSRTTAENAIFAAPAAGAGRWLLVTSAFHMPRAVGTFRKAGVSVIAAPTDWRVADTSGLAGFDAIANLSNVNLVTKEYLGLLAYWMTGRSTEILPGPDGDAC